VQAQQVEKNTWSQWTESLKKATGKKGKDLYMPLRILLTGQKHGPSMGDLLPLMKERTLTERMTFFENLLKNIRP
jgi:glutamyl-tRNA synthetase